MYEFIGERVMLDRDLAVKKNIARFPSDFMFQLTIEEWNILKKQVKEAPKLLSSICFYRTGDCDVKWNT